MNYPTTAADLYKRLRENNFPMTAKLLLHKQGRLSPDGWIYFNDGSKYNTANNQTINPGDIIV